MSFLITVKYQKAYELRKQVVTAVKARKDTDHELAKALDAFESEIVKLAREGNLKPPFVKFIFGKE